MTLSPEKTNWIDLINESVHTSDDVDIGDIDAVSRDFVVVKRGFITTHYYYIPISKVEGWDGDVLWLKIREDEVKRNYEREMLYPILHGIMLKNIHTIAPPTIRH